MCFRIAPLLSYKSKGATFMLEIKVGNIKFFNKNKGFGFIKADDGASYFFHVSYLKKEAYSKIDNIKLGARVAFSAETDHEGRLQAQDIILVDAPCCSTNVDMYENSVNHRKSGTVKFYNPTKGFGFIYIDKEGADVHFHITAINGALPPKIGDKVYFYLNKEKGKKTALDIDIAGVSSEGFPCIRGDSVKGFTDYNVIKKITTSCHDTVDEAKDELIEIAKKCGANAVVNYIWHRESDWSDDYFLIFKTGRSRKTTFWAEGNAVKLKE